MRKTTQKLKKYFHDVIKIKTSPHSIAFGFALGSFIAILPTPGFSVLVGLVLIFLFKSISKLSMFVSFAFWNPIFQIPIYLLSWRIGNFMFRNESVESYSFVLLDQFFYYTRRYLIGNFIIAVAISVSSYYIIRFAAEKYQKK